jgi:hypothetical protein
VPCAIFLLLLFEYSHAYQESHFLICMDNTRIHIKCQTIQMKRIIPLICVLTRTPGAGWTIAR